MHWALREPLPARDIRLPTIFIANHTNWWDGFLAFLVTRELGLEFRVLMDAEQLARYGLFRRVGALPLRHGSAAESYADLTSAAAVVRPDVGLWIFPQGSRRPAAEAIGPLRRGAAHLALTAGPVRVCPVALRYAFRGEQLPEAFILLGAGWTVERGERLERRELSERMRAALSEVVAQLDRLVDQERADAFLPLVAGRLSVNKRLDRFRHRLGLLAGPFEARNG